jgi:hypothetical protein
MFKDGCGLNKLKPAWPYYIFGKANFLQLTKNLIHYQFIKIFRLQVLVGKFLQLPCIYFFYGF